MWIPPQGGLLGKPGKPASAIGRLTLLVLLDVSSVLPLRIPDCVAGGSHFVVRRCHSVRCTHDKAQDAIKERVVTTFSTNHYLSLCSNNSSGSFAAV